MTSRPFDKYGDNWVASSYRFNPRNATESPYTAEIYSPVRRRMVTLHESGTGRSFRVFVDGKEWKPSE